MTDSQPERRALTTPGLSNMKREGERIACLTAYDAAIAHTAETAGVDMILIGDSLGMVVQGHSSTLPVTVDHIVYHCQAVARGASHTLLIGDMPFLSDRTLDLAMANAGRLMAEGRVHMVKMEGGGPVVAHTRELVAAGIPVCGHLGLTPQHVHQLGGYRVQGRSEAEGELIRHEAQALANAGAAALVLECVPDALAAAITADLDIPVIGIGAGPHCDGQVLVVTDALGIGPGKRPRFVRDFVADKRGIADAMRCFVEAVKAGSFPAEGESYG